MPDKMPDGDAIRRVDERYRRVIAGPLAGYGIALDRERLAALM